MAGDLIDEMRGEGDDVKFVRRVYAIEEDACGGEGEEDDDDDCLSIESGTIQKVTRQVNRWIHWIHWRLKRGNIMVIP